MLAAFVFVLQAGTSAYRLANNLKIGSILTIYNNFELGNHDVCTPTNSGRAAHTSHHLPE